MINCRKMTLPNGLRLVAVEMPHLHSAEIAIYLRVGGRNDPPAKAGLSHFLEHMLFRGTADHPSNLELETAFEAIGGSVNAATDAETTCYYSRVHPEHLAEGVRLFSSMLLRPTFPGLDIEKRIITEEALEDINEHGAEINPDNLANQLLWPGHPLGITTVGSLETIASIGEADLRGHLASFYVPAGCVIAMAGDIQAEAAFKACAEIFGAWSAPPPPAATPATALQSTPQTRFVKDSASQVNLQISFRGFARPDQRIMAARLIRRILCGGGSSRLYLALRERLGIVYSVDAGISAFEETGAFAIELSTATETLPQAVAEVLAETRRLAVEPMERGELQRIIQGYFFDLDYSRDSTYEMQVRYGWGELMGVARDIEADQAEAAVLDPAAIQAAASELFAPHNLNLVAVGPWKAATRRKVEKLVNGYAQEWGLRLKAEG